MTLLEFKLHLVDDLPYPTEEAKQITSQLIEHYLGYNKVEQALNANDTIQVTDAFSTAIERLKKYEPLQYVLGETSFFDLPFKVTPDVLIPRPETEELVQLILNENKNNSCSILDIGTGSGCIAISLKSQLSDASITAFDVSNEALEVARHNAIKNGVDVNFMHIDILNPAKTSAKYDIIVSNPPYVLEQEKELMRENVLQFEPSLALFVENNTPLLFYNAIADFAQVHLNAKGGLYFEINEAFGEETRAMLAEKGFSDAKVIQDINGKDRMIEAFLR